MVSLILCVLVLALSCLGASDVAARQEKRKIAYTGLAESAFRESTLLGPSEINPPQRFGSATEPPRASPAQNSPASSDVEKLFQAQPMSNEVQARFQRPAGALADHAAGLALSSQPSTPPTASRRERADITSSLPASTSASHPRREWFAWWSKCHPRASNRTHASKATVITHRPAPGLRQTHQMARAITAAKEASPTLVAAHSVKNASQRISPSQREVLHPPAAKRIVAADRIKKRRARLTSLAVQDGTRFAVVRHRRDHAKAVRWQTACKALRLERS
jgi:hypothetical protein